MPRIKINSIQCITPDEVDKDEMYLKKDGKKIWPEGEKYHRVDTGDRETVNLKLDVADGWNEIEVWDFDYASLNDHLGTFKFNVDTGPGKYSTSMELHERESTASYLMFWEILD